MNKFKILVVLLLVCILAGCTCNSEVEKLQKELDDLKGQLNENINSNDLNQDTDSENYVISSNNTPSNGQTPSSNTNPTEAVEVGKVIEFGGFDWQVLDIQDGKALILSDIVLEKRAYYHDDEVAITWEDSDLRAHLNNNFYNSFNSDDKARIIEVTNTTPNNPWYSGNFYSNDTKDKIFVLSVDEVIKYFGDSGQLNNRVEKGVIDDWFNPKRIIKDSNGENEAWWLRTMGEPYTPSIRTQYRVTAVTDKGIINLKGGGLSFSGGVRPAMWVKLK